MEEKKNWYDDVPAPVDRDGNVVSLATRTLYCGDGREIEVGEIALDDSKLSGGLVWRVRTPGGVALVLDLLHLAPPDSWERLADDLERYDENKVTCEYFGMEVAGGTCDGCRGRGRRLRCIASALDDVARRVAALREAERDGD